MSTQLEICNIALSYVGANPIADLAETSTEAIWCTTNYEPLKLAVLAERTWSFAEAITGVGTPTEVDGGYLYGIPADTVRVYRCYSQLYPSRQARWQRRGNGILADYDGTLYMVRTDGATLEADFPPMFTQALAGRLAMEMAIPIARSQSMLGAMVQLYEQKISAAAAADGSEGRSERHDSTELTSVRAGGYSI
jgi:hypothetical protein